MPNAYVNDIRSQAESLSDLLAKNDITRALAGLDVHAFDRIVVTGMGASHYANYQLWRDLVAAGLPAWWVETSELLGEEALLTANTLLWITSQSGRSGEVLALLNGLRGGSRAVIGVTNDESSPLANLSSHLVLIHAGAEHAVGTRTYLNTLAANRLASVRLLGANVAVEHTALSGSASALADYLAVGWDERLARTRDTFDQVDRLIVIGRGRSIGNALSAALTIKEASKVHAEGMSAGQFRHGVIELAGPDLTAVLLPDPTRDPALDVALAQDLAGTGARVVWLAEALPPVGARSLPVVPGHGFGRIVNQVVPLQLASLVLAEQAGVAPGEFRHASKITSRL